MRHTLTWQPLAALCGTAALYTVQFQGEFERTIFNDSWLDAPQCQRTPHTHCDLTSDLGSDSDYAIRVRAECGRLTSPWVRLNGLFNRRDTLLSPPEMAVAAMGDGLRVSFERLPRMASVSITFWRQGGDHEVRVMGQTSTSVLLVEQTPLLVAALQEGAVYCVQASIYLDAQRRSSPTHPQCVAITDPEEPWKKPTVAMVTVVVMAALLFAVFWSVGHCKAEGCHAHFQKEPLPLSLRPDWPKERPACPEQVEICEPITAFVLLVELT
ncbi:Interleukin-20 receptor subunit beta [Merluccius polli]|uniref:Interleukin-20 receptor subunit beta n=1 Tax=Merluccius polli TaxID=89951 RepID=A0AA47NU67_MERPO|nr:Interleukin-20 receptor subunit beta [Merluccius polli]